MTIEITQLNIDQGTLKLCPVELALLDKIPNCQPRAGRTWFHLTVEGKRRVFFFEPLITQFIRDYDNNIKVEPISFELEI